MITIKAVCSAAVIVAVLLAGLSCKSRHWTGDPAPGAVDVTVAAPSQIVAGEAVTWSASWVGGSGPYTVQWQLGGGLSEIGPDPAVSPASVDVVLGDLQLRDPVQYTYTVTVTPAQGTPGTATGSYTIQPVALTTPSIVDISVEAGVMRVTVGEPGMRDVTVTVSPIDGLSSDAASVVVPGGNGEAVFLWDADDLFTGAMGTTTVTATNDLGQSDTAEAEVDLRVFWISGDTLYVLPLTHKVAVGEPVTIVCATGALANAFLNMNNVSLIIEEDADYVHESFNYGAIGGNPTAIDGIWQQVAPASFLQTPESFLIQGVLSSPSNAIPEGRMRYQFTIAPYGGESVDFAEGIMFNFQLTFSKPGLKRIGLQQVDGIKRSYYSDGEGNEYFWGTLMADEHGELNVAVDNTILVE